MIAGEIFLVVGLCVYAWILYTYDKPIQKIIRKRGEEINKIKTGAASRGVTTIMLERQIAALVRKDVEKLESLKTARMHLIERIKILISIISLRK